MEPLIKLQMDVKNSIEKGRVNYKKSPKERLTPSFLETRLETLEQQWKSFFETHRKIVELAKDCEHSYFKLDTYESTEESYMLYKSELREHISKLFKSAKYDNQTAMNVQNNVKLPKIVIPKFSGKYTEWTSFRDLFLSLIHNNRGIDDVQKLHYLKGHLVGEAEQLLRYTPVTAANYQESWQLLTKRYDNKRYLCNAMLKRLMNQPSILESSIAIKELLDTSVDCINGLSTIGVRVDSWDVILIYIISAKLDSESRKLWESMVSACDELPTFDRFKGFLESRFRSLEYLDTPSSTQRSSGKPRVLHAVDSQLDNINALSCPFCRQPHKLSNCKEFCKNDYNTRSDFVRTKGLCFNCLGSNHTIKFCRITTTCQICKRKHHSLLHPKESSGSTSSRSIVETTSEVKSAVATFSTGSDAVQELNAVTTTTHFSKKAVPSQVLLATALVEAQTRTGCNHLLRALIDQGSQTSFITESAVQLLGLKRIPTRGVISGVGGGVGAIVSKYTVLITVKSRHDPNFNIQVQAYVLGTITSLLPGDKVLVPKWHQLEQLVLADPEYHTPNKIDLLLGADVYGQLLTEGLIKHSLGTLIAQNTHLGWILSGRTFTHSHLESSHSCPNLVTMLSHIDDNEMLKKFWEIESDTYSKRKILTQEEELCENLFRETVERDSAGRYIVNLPFRDSDPQCKYGNTRDIALRRFQLLERRFKKDPQIRQRYAEVIQEYLDLGHMEEINPETDAYRNEAVYLPHHAVIREDKSTTKVRVVFDASSKGCNGVSLNDTLMVGPTIQPDLRHIVMKWRLHPIVICSDVVKMYRQVLVTPQHTKFQRLLWRSNPESEVKEYRLTRVTFGTACAPYLAVKCLQQLIPDEGVAFPLVAEKLKEEFYVDDFMSGCQTAAQGIRIYKEMTELLKRGGFELQKWTSNSRELTDELSEVKGSVDKVVELNVPTVTKVLGISWDKGNDCFNYSINFHPQSGAITKRKVISEISRLFDPLGWVAPCVIPAKIFIQKLWLAGIDWDDVLPTALYDEWITYKCELLKLPNIIIPRWLGTQDDDIIELQGFCDASNKAYAAAVYVRVIRENQDIKVNLLVAKTKVAPIRQLSIPRLELMGAVLLASLITEVADLFNISKTNIHCWTDSTVVLAWLCDHPSRWTTFVGNRVSHILSLVESSQWSHVTSSFNPADVASRGATPIELSKCTLWFQGPTWLKNKNINYSKPKSITTEEETRVEKSHVALRQEEALWSKYSSLQRLIRVIAYCRRVLKVNRKAHMYLTSEELQQALEICIREYQRQAFNEEIGSVKRSGRVSNSSKLKALCPIIDSRGILRVGGRLEHAQFSDSMKHPIIIPQNSHLTRLLVDEAHEKTLHGGPTLMLNYLRSRYWIISAKGVVKSFVRKCVICLRHSAVFRSQLMGQLPSCRVTPARAFLHTGVDFAGPINVRVSKGRGNKAYKGYICLFVCMATRAVHLEVVSDLTSQAFIAAYKRFIARRGHCSDIWSDNGKNFVGAAKELTCLLNAEQSEAASEIRNWLSSKQVEWHFIPPHAPNFGGLWEAGIKSTKYHMKRVIGDSTLTYEELSTLLVQIEACLNSRPISQIPQNSEDVMPLTPGHFLIGESLILAPDRNYEQSNIGTLKRWQLVQKMTQDFWRRWSQEYLTQMMHRYKWSHVEPEPNIGDVVLVKEDNLPPGRWLLGRVVVKHPGLDGITRVVTLKLDEQGTSAVYPKASETHNGDHTEHMETRFNGHQKILQRLATVPDIKRDTSGLTTQYIATGIVNLGAFAGGVCVAWSSSALPLLTLGPMEPSPTRDVIAVENSTRSLLSTPHSKLEITVAEASWAASLLCLGAVFGAIPSGLISEYFGRKKTLLYLALPLLVSWILVASSPNVYGLYVGRFVGGVALGAFSVSIPPYIEDIAEKQILAAMANFYHVHFSCGVLFGYIIGLVGSTSWLSVLCASVPIAFFVAFIFLPESPAYLLSQGKFHEAKAALRYFRGIDNDIDSEIKDLREHLRNSARNRITFKQMLSTRSTLKALIVSFGLMIFQQMTGIYPVLFYAKNIFETFAISLNPPSAVIILGFCLVSSTYFSTMLLKVVRRRVLLMLSFIAMAVNLGCLGIYYHLKASNMSLNQTWVPLFTLCLFVSFYAAGVGPIPWLMLREIFPPNVTRRATAITAGFHWFLAFGATKLYQNMVEMVKPGWTLWNFAVTCLVGTIFVYFFVPETKGRTLTEIQNEFEGIHKKKKHRHVVEVESLSEA